MPRRLATVGLCWLLVLASVATAATAPPRESLASFESQLRAHHVSSATLHTKKHTLHVRLLGGGTVVVPVSSHGQQQLLAMAQSNGVTIKVVHAKAASHRRLYVAIGAIVVVILLVAGGLLLRRRRDEQGPRSPVPAG